MSAENNDMRWSDLGWTAQVVENDDGGGWALEMTLDGNTEPTLVVPWVMGRNKKDPKPLNKEDFKAQVKATQDFLTRSEAQQRRARQTSFNVVDPHGEPVQVIHDIIPDEFEPEAYLIALDLAKEELARVSCPVSYKLTRQKAQSWVDDGFPPVDGGGEMW